MSPTPIWAALGSAAEIILEQRGRGVLVAMLRGIRYTGPSDEEPKLCGVVHPTPSVAIEKNVAITYHDFADVTKLQVPRDLA